MNLRLLIGGSRLFSRSQNVIMAETQEMVLNKETALRLWNKTFGKSIKATDFAGRQILKAAYNDRGSKYGWNVDHILPQSRGGKTADYNLSVCNIVTNDEKADKWPSFVANGRIFDIVKVENHYEYKERKSSSSESDDETPSQQDEEEEPNLFDAASGIRHFKKLKGIQNKHRWVGSALLRLKNPQTNAVVDLLEEIFGGYSIEYRHWEDNNEDEYIAIIFRNYDMPLKSDTEDMLDKCILANTYLSYFYDDEDVDAYDIVVRQDYFEEKDEMYDEVKDIDFNDVMDSSLDNTLYIDEDVYRNTSASQKENLSFENGDYVKYDYYFTKLNENLKKEVRGN